MCHLLGAQSVVAFRLRVVFFYIYKPDCAMHSHRSKLTVLQYGFKIYHSSMTMRHAIDASSTIVSPGRAVTFYSVLCSYFMIFLAFGQMLIYISNFYLIMLKSFWA